MMRREGGLGPEIAALMAAKPLMNLFFVGFLVFLFEQMRQEEVSGPASIRSH